MIVKTIVLMILFPVFFIKVFVKSFIYYIKKGGVCLLYKNQGFALKITRSVIYMLTNIRSRKFELTDEMKAYIEKRMAKYDRMLGGVEEINVLVSEQKNLKKVEVTIPLHDVILRCEETDTDFFACVDRVAEKLGGPVRKHKTRLAKRMKEGSNNKRVISEMPDNVPDSQLVKYKKFTSKPYSVDEAIMQMDLLGHNFFAFINEETGKVNVVYLRHDGNYGLLEPEV